MNSAKIRHAKWTWKHIINISKTAKDALQYIFSHKTFRPKTANRSRIIV